MQWLYIFPPSNVEKKKHSHYLCLYLAGSFFNVTQRWRKNKQCNTMKPIILAVVNAFIALYKEELSQKCKLSSFTHLFICGTKEWGMRRLSRLSSSKKLSKLSVCRIPGLLKSYVLRKSCYLLIILLLAIQNCGQSKEKREVKCVHSRFKCAKVSELFLGSPPYTPCFK